MVYKTVEAMQTTLHTLEQDETLWHAVNFVPRVYALDQLSFHVLEHIENVQYVHGYNAYLARLYQRAEQLWQRLEQVNQQLFQRLRDQLRTTADRGALLQQLRATYVGPSDLPLTWEDLDADYLDIFINGVLGIARPPEETRPLQSGMIGYHPTPARAIFTLVELLHLKATDVFYDLGAGLGLVALLVGLLTPAQARGIEFEPAYWAYAQQRAEDLCLRRVAFQNADAREAAYTDGSVFFLYTPFTGQMMSTVLARLHAEARTRPITIATYGACTSVAEQQAWLTRTAQRIFVHDTLALFQSV